LDVVSVVEHQGRIVVVTVANLQYSVVTTTLTRYDAFWNFPETHVVRVSAVADALWITSESVHSELRSEVREFWDEGSSFFCVSLGSWSNGLSKILIKFVMEGLKFLKISLQVVG
jgi:hypothetical protein